MIIRGLTISFLFAVLATPAYAQDTSKDSGQDNPDTRQTDQSEEDWRKSRKKRDSGDIFKDIVTNPNNQGSGGIWGGEVKAIDRLNADSRRHLNRLRAKALAEAKPGEPIDAAYEPSEEAKTDEYLAKQEARAWKEMVEEANSGFGGTGSGPGGGLGDEQGTGSMGSGQPSDGGMAGGGQGQMGQAGSGAPGQAPAQNSPLRGGSANSASDILDQIKGRGTASGQDRGSIQGTAPAGQTRGESRTQGEAPSGGQANGDRSDQQTSDGSAQAEAQPQLDQSVNMEAEAKAAAAAQAAAKVQAVADAQKAAETAAEAAAHAETISPLERLKRDPVDRTGTGGRTSASDYLKKKQD